VRIKDSLRPRSLNDHQIRPRTNHAEHLARDSTGSSNSISTIPSRRDTGSNRTSLSERGTTTTGLVGDFFDEPPGKASRNRFFSYSFSADGNRLLLWERTGSHVAIYDINSKESDKFPAINVTFAAAGAEMCAFISQDRNVLLLFLLLGLQANQYAGPQRSLYSSNSK
jgi:hypothetical protein